MKILVQTFVLSVGISRAVCAIDYANEVNGIRDRERTYIAAAYEKMANVNQTILRLGEVRQRLKFFDITMTTLEESDFADVNSEQRLYFKRVFREGYVKSVLVAVDDEIAAQSKTGIDLPKIAENLRTIRDSFRSQEMKLVSARKEFLADRFQNRMEQEIANAASEKIKTEISYIEY
jgi:predicted amino acid racemase